MSLISKHIPFEDLVQLAERDDSRRADQTEHLQSCAKCADTVTRLEKTFALMRTDDAVDAPRDVLSLALGVFQSSEKKASIRKRIIALLSFDSLTLAPTFGTRSGQSDARQLVYSAEDNDIDLHISVKDNKWVIAGQLLGPGCNDAQVAIEGEGISLTSQLNDACEFAIVAVPPGEYKLTLRLSDIEVEVPRLALGI